MTGMASVAMRSKIRELMPASAFAPAPIAQLGDVRAGSEDPLGTVASLGLTTGDDEDAGIVFQLVTDGVQVIDHGLIDGVADLGAVEADERVGVGGLDTQGGEGHP